MSPTEPDTSTEMDEADTANGEGGPETDERTGEGAARPENDPVETP